MMFRFGVLDWQLLHRLAAGLQAAEMLGGGGHLLRLQHCHCSCPQEESIQPQLQEHPTASGATG